MFCHSKIETFWHFFNTVIVKKCFSIFSFFGFLDTFFLHTFYLTKNVIPCDKDVNENYLKHT